jgi:hypothetical protein
MPRSADDRFIYAIFPLALLVWWASSWFPNQRDFLRTGVWILLGAGVAYALYQLVA